MENNYFQLWSGRLKQNANTVHSKKLFEDVLRRINDRVDFK